MNELPTPLQETILATLCFNEKYGAAIAAQVIPEHFDGPYRDVATRVLAYRNKYGRAPGPVHLDDLFAEILTKASDHKAERLRRILLGLGELRDGLNARYAAEQVELFVRRQVLIEGIMSASDVIGRNRESEDNILEAERIIYEALNRAPTTMDGGLSLEDTMRGLSFLDKDRASLPLGIPQLDKLDAGPTKKQMLLYIAPKGSGKTWFCIHCGKQGLLHNERVLHITNEVSEEVVAARYYQMLFSLALRSSEEITRRKIILDDKGNIRKLKPELITPAYSLKSASARKRLREDIKKWGPRLSRIRIKEFPTGQLTLQQLNAYLDWLAQSQKFFPTMLIVDYPDLMALNPNDLRGSLNRTFVGLRGIAVKRDLAVVVPTQGGRRTIDAKETRSSDATEDISKVFTADIVMTYSSMPIEKEAGLGRLTLKHARASQSDVQVVLAQAYGIGQYCVQSTRFTSSYWELIANNKTQIDETSEVFS